MCGSCSIMAENIKQSQEIFLMKAGKIFLLAKSNKLQFSKKVSCDMMICVLETVLNFD